MEQSSTRSFVRSRTGRGRRSSTAPSIGASSGRLSSRQLSGNTEYCRHLCYGWRDPTYPPSGIFGSLWTTPIAYLMALRLNGARADLLKSDQLTITQAATKWGFCHLGRFSQVTIAFTLESLLLQWCAGCGGRRQRTARRVPRGVLSPGILVDCGKLGPPRMKPRPTPTMVQAMGKKTRVV